MFVWNQATLMKLQKDLEKAVLKVSEDLVNESQQEVPVDTGDLRDSVNIENKSRNNVAHTLVEYDTDYAIYVHEDLNINHPQHAKHNCGGKAKFLEDPLSRKYKEYIKKIGQVFRG
jgi:hypothetical protein